MMENHSDLKGYALVKIDPGKERPFFSGLYDIPEIEDVYFIMEGYEYMVTITGKGPEDIANTLTRKIRGLPGIERMATYIEGRHLSFAR